MVNNNILAFCRPIRFYFITVYTHKEVAMCIKVTVVAYAFSVQCFENSIIMRDLCGFKD